jgi:hypothetical protein
MKTFLIVSGVLVVGYVVYSHYNPSVVQQKPANPFASLFSAIGGSPDTRGGLSGWLSDRFSGLFGSTPDTSTGGYGAYTGP